MSLRIDRWLWFARFHKTRSLAAQAIDGGKVQVGGRRVKPSHAVNIGDWVRISHPGHVFECQVVALPVRRGPASEVALAYRESDASISARETYVERRRLAAALAPTSTERPDKHQRRDLRRLRGRD